MYNERLRNFSTRQYRNQLVGSAGDSWLDHFLSSSNFINFSSPASGVPLPRSPFRFGSGFAPTDWARRVAEKWISGRRLRDDDERRETALEARLDARHVRYPRGPDSERKRHRSGSRYVSWVGETILFARAEERDTWKQWRGFSCVPANISMVGRRWASEEKLVQSPVKKKYGRTQDKSRKEKSWWNPSRTVSQEFSSSHRKTTELLLFLRAGSSITKLRRSFMNDCFNRVWEYYRIPTVVNETLRYFA